MKSIIEEASSLSKAIENGWVRAGKPTQFSVKVFELPEKNFFGFTTKKAKIGILFEAEIPAHTQKSSQPKKHTSTTKRAQPQASESPVASIKPQSSQQQQRERSKERELRRVEQTEQLERIVDKTKPTALDRVETEKQPERFLPLVWTTEIVDFVETMIKESLSLMGLPNITFSSIPTENGLKVTFDSPILDNPIKEKQFFQSYAQVIVASVRNKYKPESRSIRLMLTSTKT